MELRALRERCDRALTGHGPVRAADLLATIPADTEVDRYGDGGVVAELEAEVAGLLGLPAAVYLPSGMMAQQAVLRVHADRRGAAHRRLPPGVPPARSTRSRRWSGCRGWSAGRWASRHRLLLREHLERGGRAPAALLVELPQRDLGGAAAALGRLVAQVAWARERGAAAHLDGARLWEAAAGYGLPPGRGRGAVRHRLRVASTRASARSPAAAWPARADVVAEVREWRRRMGGTLFGLWPGAASALTCLRRRLPLMPRLPRAAPARSPARVARPAGRRGRARPAADADAAPAAAHDARRRSPPRPASSPRDGLWTWERAMTTGDPAVAAGGAGRRRRHAARWASTRSGTPSRGWHRRLTGQPPGRAPAAARSPPAPPPNPPARRRRRGRRCRSWWSCRWWSVDDRSASTTRWPAVTARRAPGCAAGRWRRW